jgi:hypothetical protein
VAITSVPYAKEREYDSSSGFKPVSPEEYVEWFRAVADGIESVLAPDGSRLLNVKEHADEGEGNLCVRRCAITRSFTSGAGGSSTSFAGARPATVCLVGGETASRTDGSRRWITLHAAPHI